MKTPSAEQPSGSPAAGQKFQNLSLDEMEKALSEEKEDLETVETEADTKPKESETSDKKSSQKEDQSTPEDKTESTEDKTPKDKQEIDYKKAYEALQPEYTRSRQELKDRNEEIARIKETVQGKSEQGDVKKKPSVLAQLKEKNPEAAELLEALKEEMKAEVLEEADKKVKPVEERVVLRERERNRDAFVTALREFKTSDLAGLEAEVVQIFNEEPNFWQRIVFERPDAFELLKREMFYKFPDRLVEEKTKKKKDSKPEDKGKRADEAHVEGKTKVSSPKPTDKMDLKEFKKLSLKDMENLLPNSED